MKKNLFKSKIIAAAMLSVLGFSVFGQTRATAMWPKGSSSSSSSSSTTTEQENLDLNELSEEELLAKLPEKWSKFAELRENLIETAKGLDIKKFVSIEDPWNFNKEDELVVGKKAWDAACDDGNEIREKYLLSMDSHSGWIKGFVDSWCEGGKAYTKFIEGSDETVKCCIVKKGGDEIVRGRAINLLKLLHEKINYLKKEIKKISKIIKTNKK